jgi:membrane-bound lytic murein transglycosylase D
MMISKFYKNLGKSHTNYNYKSISTTNEINDNTPESVYKERFEKMNENSSFHFVYNSEVKQWLDLYAKRRKGLTSRMFSLAPLYFPVFEEMLDKYNMPLEIKYLAIVESALNAQAVSPAKAVGLWQFIPGTGKMYGLDNNYLYDARMDLYKSTEAACRFMCDLYKEFKDWELVLAAYNCGPGNVNKAIRRSGGKTKFWEIMQHLPRETRGYVPAFIAVNYVMRYAAEHQIVPTNPIFSGYLLDTVCLKGGISLASISASMQIPLEDLKWFNPQFKKGIIPNNGEYYTLYLPYNKTGEFIVNEQTLFAQHKEFKNISQHSVADNTNSVHYVRKGETLSVIANKYSCTVTQLKDWNNLKSTNLQVGQKLSLIKQTSAITSSKVIVKSTDKYHVVQAGDTLYKIAQLNGISVNKIKELNKGIQENTLKVGMKIKISSVG